MILTKSIPTHVRTLTGLPLDIFNPNSNLQFGLEMPHFLNIKRGEATLILPSALALIEGDMISTEREKEFMVMEVQERRKARGNWSKNPFDVAPDWARIKFL